MHFRRRLTQEVPGEIAEMILRNTQERKANRNMNVNDSTLHAECETSMDTVLQVFYAVAIGFSFMMAFYKSGSLIPCILTHSVFDIASTFSNPTLSAQAERILNLGGTVFLIVVAGGYALYLIKVKPAKAAL